MKTEEIKALDIKTLLSNGDEYVIPIYQRNYAWEAKEIEQLLQDIIDYSKHHKDKNYYIGTLVVANNEQGTSHYYNTIDGQQRLTTLTLLSSVIKNNFSSEVDLNWFSHLNLSFASRQKSMLSIKAAFAGKFENKNYEINIRNGYNICLKELDKKLGENEITLNDFTTYLYQYVKILRVPLPDGIDLNHYFEIMNSRGEQLEKHEILKAELMSCFNNLNEREKYETVFDLVWEACSNMEKYVQYGFSVEQRHIVFGQNDWNNLSVYDFDDLLNKLGNTINNTTSIESDIDNIIKTHLPADKKEENEDAPDRFNSVVNFQNFLLHVLRVQLKKDEIALDDKRLIELFKQEMRSLDNSTKLEFVKQFIYNLLMSKFLFDKYVIKREFTANTDRWSLKALKWYSSGKTKNGVKYVNTFGEETNESFDNDNRKVLMLLSMFHVSIPSMSYKYWLNASLNYLIDQIDIDSKDYISYLEHIAKAFVYDRFLAKIPKNYFEMIYLSKGPIIRNIIELDLGRLKYGAIENNLLFNYCDYLLWLKMKDNDKDPRVKSFEYTFRSSVEHHYPQNPINADVIRIDEKYLHQFGNLCLISHEKNSRLNNLSPSGKKDYYPKGVPFDSIKQHIMMERNPWEIKQIEDHNDEMTKLLKDNISSSYSPKTDVSNGIKWFNDYKVRDKALLIRALLCFGDCTKPLGGNRYKIDDWDYLRSHEAFTLFENYIAENTCRNLVDLIKKRSSLQSVKNSWRYLIIKHEELVKYCVDGIIDWNEKSDGKLIYILKSQKNTTHSAVEVFNFCFKIWLKTTFNIDIYTDNCCSVFNIRLGEDGYELTGYSSHEMQLWLWNESGETFNHKLVLKENINGNSLTIKTLVNDFNWYRQEKGEYIRKNKEALFEIRDNFEENEMMLKKSVIRLLKNGFDIKLK